MKKRITAVVLALALLLALPGSAAAYSLTKHAPNWRVSSSYEYFVEVCADASTGSTTWTIGTIPLHDRVRDAVAQWNNLSTNLRFSLSNSCVIGETAVTVSKGAFGTSEAKAQFDKSQLFCEGPEWSNPSPGCWQHAELWINTSFSWYNMTGTPPGNQYDLYSAFVHEFGHGVGAPDLVGAAGDCSDPNLTLRESMCGDASLLLGTTWARSVSADDIAAFHTHY